MIVSTPQNVAIIDTRKGVAMFRKLGIPVCPLECSSTKIDLTSLARTFRSPARSSTCRISSVPARRHLTTSLGGQTRSCRLAPPSRSTCSPKSLSSQRYRLAAMKGRRLSCFLVQRAAAAARRERPSSHSAPKSGGGSTSSRERTPPHRLEPSRYARCSYLRRTGCVRKWDRRTTARHPAKDEDDPL